MKQCPNPNCILYTRLDELPDAYLKCPGCGGLLVDADTTSRVLSSGHLSKKMLTSVAVATYPDDEPAAAYTQQPLPLDPSIEGEYEYEDDYAHEGEEAYDYGYATQPAAPLLRTGRVLFLVGSLLFIGVCAGLVLVSNRLAPQNRAIAGPQATETALAFLRPPVNTPIPLLPTISSSGWGDTGINVPGLPSVQSSPIPNPQSLTSATAPPAQTNPGAGVLEALMCLRLEGGQPVGNVSAYNPDNTFNLAVQANFGPGSVTSVTTRWYGPEGKMIYELRKEYQQPGTYYAGFTLRRATPWATGDYRVDVHTNDAPVPAYSVPFSVVP